MTTRTRFALILSFVLSCAGVLALAGEGAAAAEKYTLAFIPTQNAPPGALATLKLEVTDRRMTKVNFKVSGAHPNTVYTLWIVFNRLLSIPATGVGVPSSPASERPGFPPEGNAVSPFARLDSGFTSGMGLDPGASFITDGNGRGQFSLTLDYDLTREAPVSNKDMIVQCVPGPVEAGACPPPSRLVRVTTTWLRQFIGQVPAAERSATCANYDPLADPTSGTYNPITSKGMNALLWQCVDPATVDPSTGTGLPRVRRFTFDHIRLANHPDDLTHGFIGGNSEVDHWIDMVGRAADLVPSH